MSFTKAYQIHNLQFIMARPSSKLKVCGTLKENLWSSSKITNSSKNKWSLFKERDPQLHYPQSTPKRVHIEPTHRLYGNRLKAKQKLRAFYGNIHEKAFRATSKKSLLHDNLIGLLESRLDTVLYRMHFGSSPFAIRQWIAHGAFLVNGQPIYAKGFQLQPGDLIETKEDPRFFRALTTQIHQRMEKASFLYPLPPHLEVSYSNLSAIFLYTPSLSEVFYPVSMDIDLVKEFYK